MDEYSIRYMRDQLFQDPPRNAYRCLECRRPTDGDVEFVDSNGKGTGEYLCNDCCEEDLKY